MGLHILTEKGWTSLEIHILTKKEEGPHWECASSLRRGETLLGTDLLIEKGNRPRWEHTSLLRRRRDLTGKEHPHRNWRGTILGTYLLTENGEGPQGEGCYWERTSSARRGGGEGKSH